MNPLAPDPEAAPATSASWIIGCLFEDVGLRAQLLGAELGGDMNFCMHESPFSQAHVQVAT